MKTENLPVSVLTKRQYKSFGPKSINGWGQGAAIWAHIRHDDECGNGHNSFAITGTVRVPGQRGAAAFGCLHDEIAKVFPELAPLIKWHLCSTDGPLHYVANTVYLAGNRNHNGHAKGDPSSWDWVVKWDYSPIEWQGSTKFVKWLQDVRGNDFEVLPVDHAKEPGGYQFKPKFTLGGYDCRWHEAPFDTEREALQFVKAMGSGFKVLRVPTAWSEGKERELDAARNAAIWPDATDAELSLPPDELKEKLMARLPVLMVEFRAVVESLGFTY